MSDRPRIFISYARSDGSELAQKLYDNLGNKGFDVWLDKEKIEGGTNWSYTIEQQIDERDVIVAVLTKGAYDSHICRCEHLRSLRKGKLIVPILTDSDVERPLYLEHLHYVDFTNSAGLLEALEIPNTRLFESFVGRANALTESYRLTNITLPELPQNLILRSDMINAVRNLILRDTGERTSPIIGLYGLVGTGKSVLAVSLCHDEVIQDAFPGGIFWFSNNDTEEALAKNILSETNSLRDNNALIIIDNVLNAKHINSITKNLRKYCILITTRDRRVVDELGAEAFHVSSFEPDHSRKFLLSVSGRQNNDVSELAKRLDHHPLALKIAGEHLKNGTDIPTLLKAYPHLSTLKVGSDPKISETNLNVALSQSVNLLACQNLHLFHVLGIFPNCNSIPKAVVRSIWKKIDSTLNDVDCNETMAEFASLDLIHVEQEKNDISLSPLLHDYAACALAHGHEEMHRTLLSAYNPSAQKWHEVKGDGYLSGNLIYHLLGAGQHEEARNLLLDYSWLQKTIKSVGIYAVLDYYQRSVCSLTCQNDDSLIALFHTLRQSAHILAKYPDQLAYQLLGRLHDCKTEAVISLLTKVRQSFSDIYLQPLTTSLYELAAFVCTLLGHNDEITCISFTNDAKHALSGSKDTTIKVWDTHNWQEVRTLRGHTKAVKALCISTDDNYVITASDDKTIKIWEIESGREVASWIAHIEAVNSVAITSRKPWIISASNDGTIKIWEYSVAEPAKQRILYSSRIHPISVNKIAVSPDEKSLFIACGDGSLRVLDISNLDMLDDAPPISLSLQSKNQHSGAVNDIAIARDGKYILSASSDNLLKIWDIENKNEIRTIRGHTNAVKAVKWLPKVQESDTEVQIDKPGQHEEHVISSSGIGQLRVWDAVTGHSRLILKAHTSGINDLAIEGKSRVFITASSDKSLKVWNINELFEPSPFIGHKEAVTSVKISPDGRLAVSASGDGIVRVWNIADSKKLAEWLAHDDRISDIALTADGKKLLTASWDKRLRLWDVETGRRIRSWEHNPFALSHVTITQDQKEIVYAYANGEIGIVSLVSNDRPFSFLPHRVQLSALLVSPDGKKIIAAYADQTILKWDRASGTCDWSVSMTNGAATSMILTPNGSLLFIGEKSGSISILHTETGDKLRQWGEKHEQAVSGLSLSGSKYLISSSIDQTIRVWDIQGQRQLTKFDIGASLQCSTMSSDSRTIVAGDVLGRVHLFRLENTK